MRTANSTPSTGHRQIGSWQRMIEVCQHQISLLVREKEDLDNIISNQKGLIENLDRELAQSATVIAGLEARVQSLESQCREQAIDLEKATHWFKISSRNVHRERAKSQSLQAEIDQFKRELAESFQTISNLDLLLDNLQREKTLYTATIEQLMHQRQTDQAEIQRLADENQQLKEQLAVQSETTAALQASVDGWDVLDREGGSIIDAAMNQMVVAGPARLLTGAGKTTLMAAPSRVSQEPPKSRAASRTLTN